MSLSLSAMRELVSLGLTAEQILRVAEAQAEAPKARTAAAERQARYRARQEAEKGQGDVTRDVTSDASPSVTDPFPLPSSPQTPQLPTPIPGDITLRARKGPDRKRVAEGFLAFWEAYPRKVGKDDAAKAFTKAMARIDAADPLAVILDGIERAMPGWTDKQFIPHPATWLNKGRWADEAPEITSPRARNDQQPSNPRRDAKLAGFERAIAAAGVAHVTDAGWCRDDC